MTWGHRLFVKRYRSSYWRWEGSVSTPDHPFFIFTYKHTQLFTENARIKSYPAALCLWHEPFDVTNFVMPRPYECGWGLYRRIADLFLKAWFFTNRTENSIPLPPVPSYLSKEDLLVRKGVKQPSPFLHPQKSTVKCMFRKWEETYRIYSSTLFKLLPTLIHIFRSRNRHQVFGSRQNKKEKGSEMTKRRGLLP
jgi:hypothetical protein